MIDLVVRVLAVLGVLCAFVPDAAAGFTNTLSTDPFPGIHRETWFDSSIPARLRLIRIDLSNAEIALYATPQADRGITTSAFYGLVAADVAVNGDSFSVAGYTPTGLAMGAVATQTPAIWSGTADDATSAVFDFHREPNINGGSHIAAEIVPPEVIVTPGSLPAGTQGVVSGRPLLVRSGVPESQFDCNDQTTLACERAPRSALAVSADGRYLWIAVVDGWQTSSLGLTCSELAQFLTDHGADMAVALDGGSSSTLVMSDTVISSPSDGVERAVANHLAVKYSALPGGELLGLVCEKELNPCTAIAAATVTLDDGTSQPTSSTGIFDFQNITPRLVCATAKKTGYYPNTRCVYVSSNTQNYDSIALQPCPSSGCVVRQDAGVVDAAEPPPDASRLRDGGGRDAGNGATGPGGGCCDAGRDRPDVLVFVAVAWFLTRRRGTNGWGQ